MSHSFATPRTAAHQAPLSMGFPRQQYWSGLPSPSPGDLSHPGIEPTSSALAGRFLTPLSEVGSPRVLPGGLNDIIHAKVSTEQRAVFSLTLTGDRQKSKSFHYPGVPATGPPPPDPKFLPCTNTYERAR